MAPVAISPSDYDARVTAHIKSRDIQKLLIKRISTTEKLISIKWYADTCSTEADQTLLPIVTF